jgi:hypothetical protein
MVFPGGYYCEKCGEKYSIITNKWCKLCSINDLRNNTSGNKIIDNLIREIQLKVDSYEDIIFEWIPHSQFNNIKEIGIGGFSKVYSAIWKEGLLKYNISKNKYIRKKNEKVALKCLYNNSQDITNEFLNEV